MEDSLSIAAQVARELRGDSTMLTTEAAWSHLPPAQDAYGTNRVYATTQIPHRVEESTRSQMATTWPSSGGGFAGTYACGHGASDGIDCTAGAGGWGYKYGTEQYANHHGLHQEPWHAGTSAPPPPPPPPLELDTRYINV